MPQTGITINMGFLLLLQAIPDLFQNVLQDFIFKSSNQRNSNSIDYNI